LRFYTHLIKGRDNYTILEKELGERNKQEIERTNKAKECCNQFHAIDKVTSEPLR